MIFAASRLRLLILSLIGGFLFALPLYSDGGVQSSADIKNRKSVLVINSYHPGYSWSDDILKGEFSSIRESFPDCIFLVEYIDCKRFYNKDFLALTKESVAIKLRSFHPDVIIANDNTAADFVFKYRDEFFAGKPVVFCGFNGYEYVSDSIPDGVTGVAEELYLSDTIEMILKLHPSVKEIRIFSSGMGMGPITDPEVFFLRKLDIFKGRVNIVWDPHEHFDEVVECSGNAKKDSVILVGGFDSFEGGAFYSQDDVVKLLSRISMVPVYSLFQTCNDGGILGLGTVCPELQGLEAGQLVTRILNGEKVSDIKVVEKVPWQPEFDSAQMEKWGIEKADLPPGSIVLNEVPGFYDTYKPWIWLVIALMLLQSLVILILLYRRIFIKLKRDLSLSQASFKNIMDSSPFVSIIVTDLDGTITLFNSGSEKMLGYKLDEVKGRNVLTLLCPPNDRERLFNEVRAKYGAEVADKDIMAHISAKNLQDQESAYMRADGSFCYVDVTVSPIIDYSGNSSGYLVVASDLTAAHKAQRQLQESQKFLRSVIDSTRLRIFWKDCNSVYLGCNKAFADDIGLESTDAIIGKKDSEMSWRGEMADSFVELDQGILTRRVPNINYEEFFVAFGGRKMKVRTSKMPLLDMNDDLIGVLGMYEDITDYKRLQEIVEKRIVALTRCMEDPDTVEFDKLFNIEEIQRIQDEFSESTNVSSVIVSPSGNFITVPSRVSCLCQLVMAGGLDKCECCFELMNGLEPVGQDDPLFKKCEGSGLCMAVSPIFVGGTYVASWIIGQVRIETLDNETLRALAEKSGVSSDAFIKAYHEVPVVTKEKFESIARSAHTLCSQLSIFASQNIQQAAYLAEEKRHTEEIKRYHTAIEQIPDGVIIVGRDEKIQFANPAFTKITGYSQEEAIGMSPMALCSGRDSDEVLKRLIDTVKAGKVWNGRLSNCRKDGTIYTEETVISPVLNSSREIVSYVATMRDVSVDIAREEELRHRQKMAAIGQLAGGVAHDFNNILQSILGFGEMLSTRFAPGSVDYQNLMQIITAAKRAAVLTRGLLALGRRDQGAENLKLIDLNHLLNDSALLIDLMSTENITIVYDLYDGLWPVAFSTDKFYQVLMNLVINARDAMPDGGQIVIRTRNLPYSDLNQAHLEPGDYVCLSVEDEGCGMSEEILENIFDPFFTTKDIGKGTGLGLAMVYVNVENCRGEIRVESEIGKGTKFFVYLPKKIG